MKNIQDQQKEFPWVKTTITLQKYNFDRKDTQSMLKSKFSDLKCGATNCLNYATAVKEDSEDVRCKMHMPQSRSRDSFKKLTLVWYEFEEKLKNLEEEYIKTECIYKLIMSPKVYEAIDEFSFNDVKSTYESMQDLLNQVKQNTMNIGLHPTYEDFSSLTELFENLQKKVEKVHQIIGTSLCYFMSSKMMNNIVTDAKASKGRYQENRDEDEDVNDIPEGVYDRAFYFYSLFTEPDEKIEEFNIGPKEVLGSDSEITSKKVLENFNSTYRKKSDISMSTSTGGLKSNKPEDSSSPSIPQDRGKAYRKGPKDKTSPNKLRFPVSGGLNKPVKTETENKTVDYSKKPEPLNFRSTTTKGKFMLSVIKHFSHAYILMTFKVSKSFF